MSDINHAGTDGATTPKATPTKTTPKGRKKREPKTPSKVSARDLEMDDLLNMDDDDDELVSPKREYDDDAADTGSNKRAKKSGRCVYDGVELVHANKVASMMDRLKCTATRRYT